MTTEAEALARLDELRRKRTDAQQAERAVLDEIKAALREAGSLRVDGEPINRSKLIEHSGLSRRTAYRILDTLPTDPHDHERQS